MMSQKQLSNLIDTCTTAAREALKGAQIEHIDEAMNQLISCSDLFDPVMIEASGDVPLCEFCGMVVITILQIRGIVK